MMEVGGWGASPGGVTSPGAGGGGGRATLDIPLPQPMDFLHRDRRAEEMPGGHGISRCQSICVSAGTDHKEVTGPRGSVLLPRLTENSLGSLDRQVSKTHAEVLSLKG